MFVVLFYLLGIQSSRCAARAPMGGRDRTSGSVSTSATKKRGKVRRRKIGGEIRIRVERKKEGQREMEIK